MINKLKLAFIAAVALASIASPALAQSAWTSGTAWDRAGAGYPSPYGSGLYSYAPNTAPGYSNGLRGYDMVPRTDSAGRYSPAANGGGSRGYN
jgi:hypothetical protein